MCGQPITIDRPAIYFSRVKFLLSHTGWPWVSEAIAMALKFPNVYLGTGAYPPKHWDPALHSFLRGPGRTKTIFGTNFPTVGHRHALGQIEQADLKPDVRDNFLRTNAMRIFSRLR
jgi:predicted TIM-barrel fold metal-dependent hydrolase